MGGVPGAQPSAPPPQQSHPTLDAPPGYNAVMYGQGKKLKF